MVPNLRLLLYWRHPINSARSSRSSREVSEVSSPCSLKRRSVRRNTVRFLQARQVSIFVVFGHLICLLTVHHSDAPVRTNASRGQESTGHEAGLSIGRSVYRWSACPFVGLSVRRSVGRSWCSLPVAFVPVRSSACTRTHRIGRLIKKHRVGDK